MSATLRAILFDFDGTLAPNLDLPDMRRQVLALTATYNVPEPVYDGRYIVEVIDAASAWLHAQDPAAGTAYHTAAHQLITDIELRAAQHTDPFPGIPDKLAELQARGVGLGVVTRNCRAAVLDVFPQLLKHVDALYARDDTPHLKPDTRHLDLCLNALDCPPHQAAMVGDGALDIRAGRALGMYCIGVLSGSADHGTLTDAGAHLVLDHCLDLQI